MELTSEQISEIAKAVADRMKAEQSGDNNPPQPAPQVDQNAMAAILAAMQQQQQPKDEPKDDEPLTTATLRQMLEEMQKTSNKSVVDTMFNDRLKELTGKLDGFDEFLDQKDPFGKKYREGFEQIESYEDRVKALEQLATTYREAMANPNSTPPGVTVPKKEKTDEQKKVEEEYAKLEKLSSSTHALRKEGIETPGDLKNAFMDSIEKIMQAAAGEAA